MDVIHRRGKPLYRLWLALLFSGCAANGSGKPGGVGSPATQSKTGVHVAAPTPGSARLYTGPDGLRLAQVRLEDGTYLMRIGGSESPIEGKILPYVRVENGQDRLVFATQLNGREFWVLHRSNRGGSVRYEVFVPYDRLRHGVQVVVDEKESPKVDTEQLIAGYRTSLADGSLEQLRLFKRNQEQAGVQTELDQSAVELNKACGSAVTIEVDWTTIDDQTLKRLSIASYCTGPVEALEQLCESPGVRRLVQAQLKQIHCRFAPTQSIQLQGDTIQWQVAEGAPNLTDYARTYLAEQASWRSGKAPAELTYEEGTEICSDGKTVFVGQHPHRDPTSASSDTTKQIFFGDGKSFIRVPQQGYLGEGWFYDPRFFTPTHNENLRGVDYRFHSQFNIDRKAGRCELICADRTLQLKLLPREQVSAIVKSAHFSEVTDRRVPYGLARDRRGIYYYVDRGAERDAKDYRLYRGPTGKLRLLKMTNIVSDTKGDVFATRSGSLRFVLEPAQAFWIGGAQHTKLINVPTQENLQLIYNELGVYLGKPFGTPCDLL